MHQKLIHGKSFSQLENIYTSYKLSPLQGTLLSNVLPDKSDWEPFLKDDITAMHSPFLLPDITESILSIEKHIGDKKHILLFGDRDTDGISSTSLLGIYLRKEHEAKGGTLTIKTSSANDDYGLCPSAVSFIKKTNPDLLITLDFGTSNYNEINELAASGIDVIVLDHHEIPLQIPKCKLVNPKREDSLYPEKKICTSVLAMKLILACRIAKRWKETSKTDSLFPDYDKHFKEINIKKFLQEHPDVNRELLNLADLSSIGTITDMMPLLGENRSIVKAGLRTLSEVGKGQNPDRKGLFFIFSNLKLNKDKVTSKDLGWSLGPVLNAAGRMGRTEVALNLLLSEENSKAELTAKELLKLNDERKERTKRNIDRVERYFERKAERKETLVIFCYEPDMEPGVSGIVATKLVEQYKRPAIFITPDHGHARGSIRSYGDENVLDLLKMVEDCLLHYGGHKEAGGFSIEIKKIPLLEEKLKEVAPAWLESFESSIENRESLVSFSPSELTVKIFQELEFMEPFGLNNPEPLLSVKSSKIINFKPMSGGKHAKFQVLGTDPKIKFVIWNKAEDLEKIISLSPSVDLWGHMEENFFNSSTSIQFVVSGFQETN